MRIPKRRPDTTTAIQICSFLYYCDCYCINPCPRVTVFMPPNFSILQIFQQNTSLLFLFINVNMFANLRVQIANSSYQGSRSMYISYKWNKFCSARFFFNEQGGRKNIYHGHIECFFFVVKFGGSQIYLSICLSLYLFYNKLFQQSTLSRVLKSFILEKCVFVVYYSYLQNRNMI